VSESDDARLAAMAEALARLEQRQEEILTRLERLEAGAGATQQARPEPPPIPVSRPWVAPQPEPPQAESPRGEPEIPAFARSEEPASPAFETRMGLTWVNRVGVVTLVRLSRTS
jgi:uncharacterized membrane protein